MANQPRPFDRATIEEAFGLLAERAAAAGKVIEISVYGGAALILTLEARPATRDVDAVFERDATFVRAAARQVAADFGWDETWLNDGVKGFLSASDAGPEAKRLFREYPRSGTPSLRVLVATPEYLFAMKALAMRIGGAEGSQDVDDIRRLARALGIVNAKQAVAVVARYYPSEKIPAKTQLGLEEVFGPGDTTP